MKKHWTYWLLFSLSLSLGARADGSGVFSAPGAEGSEGSWHPQLLKALLPQGSVLRHLGDGKKTLLSRDLYVTALKGLERTAPVYILDQEQNVAYSASSDQVIFIDQVSDLLTPPRHYRQYPPPLPPPPRPPLQFSQEVSLALYHLSTPFLHSLEGEKTDPALGTSLHYQCAVDMDVVVFGGQLAYFLAAVASGEQQFKLQQFSLGPTVGVALVRAKRSKLLLQVSQSLSPLFKVQSSRLNREFRFGSQSLGAGLQWYFFDVVADFMLGVHFSREFVSPRGRDFPSPAPGKTTNQRWSLVMGVRW